ncbi:MAG: sigmaY antisigma factor component [Clostridia bacterium]|nr:sigmaY antisigma factor component [Clostridia bacterium]
MNSGLHGTQEISLPGWIALAVILFTQSIWLFTDGQKRSAKYWFWGIWGLTTFPMPTILYLIFVRRIFKKKEN